LLRKTIKGLRCEGKGRRALKKKVKEEGKMKSQKSLKGSCAGT
jgi:hypothetical protein